MRTLKCSRKGSRRDQGGILVILALLLSAFIFAAIVLVSFSASCSAFYPLLYRSSLEALERKKPAELSRLLLQVQGLGSGFSLAGRCYPEQSPWLPEIQKKLEEFGLSLGPNLNDLIPSLQERELGAELLRVAALSSVDTEPGQRIEFREALDSLDKLKPRGLEKSQYESTLLLRSLGREWKSSVATLESREARKDANRAECHAQVSSFLEFAQEIARAFDAELVQSREDNSRILAYSGGVLKGYPRLVGLNDNIGSMEQIRSIFEQADKIEQFDLLTPRYELFREQSNTKVEQHAQCQQREQREHELSKEASKSEAYLRAKLRGEFERVSLALLKPSWQLPFLSSLS